MDIGATNWNEDDNANTAAAPDGAPEGMAPSGVNNVLRAAMGAIKRWFNWSIPRTTAGSATAYTLGYGVAPGALVDGMTHLVQFHAANGAGATLNVNGLGAIPLHHHAAGAWSAVPAGAITANMICRVAYNTAAGAYRITSWSAAPARPGGSNAQVQFNDGGTFGGDGGLLYDKAADTLSVSALAAGSINAGNVGSTNMSCGNYTGTWNGNAIPTNRGGTGLTSIPQSIATNGYATLLGNIRVQWGQSYNISSADTVWVTFPIAFGGGPYGAPMLVPISPTSAVGSANAQSYVSSVNSSGFAITNMMNSTVSYAWFAIGSA